MKKSKLLALFLALALTLALVIPAFAAPMAETGKITISAPPNHTLTEDPADKFLLFHLYNVEFISGPVGDLKFVYEPTETLLAFLTNNAASVASYGVTVPIEDVGEAAEEFRRHLQGYDGAFDNEEIIDLARIMVRSTMAPLHEKKTPASGSVVFDNLPYGYYLAVGQGTHADFEGKAGIKDNISRGMLVNVPGLKDTAPGWDENVDITLKIDVPTIEKELLEDDGTTWGDETDRNIGDDIEYRIKAQVPNMTGFKGYSFIVRDYMTKGLTFNNPPAANTTSVKTNVTVTLKSNTDATKSSNYTHFDAHLFDAATLASYLGDNIRAKYTAGGMTLTIPEGETLLIVDFTTNEDNMKMFMGLSPDDYLEITYSAKLNENAVIGVDGNPNRVILDYNTNPNMDQCDLGSTPEEVTIVYTFDLNLLKVNEDDHSKTLEGAEFVLVDEKTGNVLNFNYDSDTNTYTRAKDQADGAPKLISDKDGVIYIKGLDAGTYSLQETKAPTGYNLPKKDFTFEIVHLGEGEYEINGENGLGLTCYVENGTGGILPGTGGIGTYVFYGAGLSLAVLLAAAFVVYKRKRTLGVLGA